jgi:hypothetical protein
LIELPTPVLPADSIEQRFLAFHDANPEVYAALVRLAREARYRGATKLGLRQLWEVMRWEQGNFGVDDDYQLNDNFISRYARMIMRDEPDLTGIFELRTLHSPSVLFPPGIPPGQDTLFGS